MTDRERAAALADEIAENAAPYEDRHGGFSIVVLRREADLIVSALRDYASHTLAVSEEMVERAAEKLNLLWCPTCVPFSATDTPHQGYCRRSARAALEAALGAPRQDAPASPQPAVVREVVNIAGDSADTLAHEILGAHCACYAEAWPAHTCANEQAAVAAQIRAAGYPLAPVVRPCDGDTEAQSGPFARRTQLGYPALGWTCFHCGETFTTTGAARDHFGCDQLDDPACRIKVDEERGLVSELRKAEAEIRRLCSEEADYQNHLARSAPVVAGQTVGPGLVAVQVDEFLIIENEARRYASFYPPGSDGRNTFVIFADFIASRAEEVKP